jgi:23S rRNA (uridine2552-2'-O)-methyltransferase
LIRPGDHVVDLGAAPGSWSQIARQLIGHHGRVYALDILPMDAMADVDFIQGDFTEEAVLLELLASVGDKKVDVVLSDMSPNMSGVVSVDQPRSMYLAELALDCAQKILSPRGVFVSKLFHGAGFDQYIKQLRGVFDKVDVRKPQASRSRSKEVYVVAKMDSVR